MWSHQFIFIITRAPSWAYSEPEGKGQSFLMRQQNADLRNNDFNGPIKSMEINGTCKWIFYTRNNFEGTSFILDTMIYDISEQEISLSSVRALPPDDQSALALFEGPNYTGRMLVLYQTEKDTLYSHHNFNNRAQSAIITGTTLWTFFFHGEFKGDQVTLQHGYYPTLPDNGQVSSVIMNGDAANKIPAFFTWIDFWKFCILYLFKQDWRQQCCLLAHLALLIKIPGVFFHHVCKLGISSNFLHASHKFYPQPPHSWPISP